ncbi:MAG: hypothetical protein WC539_10220 [Nitrospirota bacterium]
MNRIFNKILHRTIIVLSVLFLSYPIIADACSINDQKQIRIGASEGIEGICSNNGSRISCQFKGDEISCDGPGGGYSGTDLKSLIFSACGCSTQEEKKESLKKEWEKQFTPSSGTTSTR